MNVPALNKMLLPKLWPALVAGLVALTLLLGINLSAVHADTPEQDLARINTSVEHALTAAQSGDIATADREFKEFDAAWDGIEDGIKDKSKDAYRAIEQKMTGVEIALAAKPVDAQALANALDELKDTNEAFIKGAAPASGENANSGASKATMATVLEQLDSANKALAAKDYAKATSEIKEFQTSWLDVEGLVKTRSASDYTGTENDMSLVYTLLTQNPPDATQAKIVLDRMTARLQPYLENTSYGVFDAMIILLREGLEALLVVVALLTFLKKSGNARKQPWIWAGVGVGLFFSIALAVVIQLVFSSAINASNRELIEGIVGLVAAAMLFYVSYWMHGKSSAAAWNRYIKQKSSAALATGSLFGLALLSFLAIFREGAETALFYLGIGSSISTSDLLLGLGLGLVILLVIGFLMVVVGLRLPIGPFFTVASVLVFFLCFKFVGMGIHALQVAQIVQSTSASYLPANDFLGLFPTWETTIVQGIILLVAVGYLVYSRFRKGSATSEKPAPGKQAVSSQQ